MGHPKSNRIPSCGAALIKPGCLGNPYPVEIGQYLLPAIGNLTPPQHKKYYSILTWPTCLAKPN